MHIFRHDLRLGVFSLLFAVLPVCADRCVFRTWSGHGYRQINGDLRRAANKMSEPFAFDFDGFGDKFGYTVCPNEGIKEFGVLLRQQNRLVGVAIVVDVTEVRSGEQAIALFAAEGDPATVAGPARPGFALVTVAIEPAVFVAARFLGGFQIHYVQVAAGAITGPAAVITHAEDEPAPVGADFRLQDTQAGVMSGKQGLELTPPVAVQVVTYSLQVVFDLSVSVGRQFVLVGP